MVTVVVVLRPGLRTTDAAEVVDVEFLNVGVTVADGLVTATALALLTSTKGLIGVVVVEVPITLGKGAVFKVGLTAVLLLLPLPPGMDFSVLCMGSCFGVVPVASCCTGGGGGVVIVADADG